MYRFKSDFLGVIRIADGLVISFDDADPNKPAFDEWAKDHLPAQPEFTLAERQAQNADAPIKPLSRELEWFEDSRVGLPELDSGAWVRSVERIDLRSQDNLELLKQRLLAKLSQVRWERETGGVQVMGALVKTDRESQSTITGAFAMARADSATTVQWKANNGFVALDSDAVIMFGSAVFAHVQGCFAHEAAFTAQINKCTKLVDLLVIAEMIGEGWGA